MLIKNLLEKNSAPFFNMTMFADENMQIISMEKFASMLDYVECGEEMVLAFKNKPSFEHAIQVWNWVNEDETHSFIMMANHPACGKEDRQPYYIYDVDYDEEKNIAYLYGEEKRLRDIVNTFDVEFGNLDLPEDDQSELSRRWPFNDDLEGSFDISLESDYTGTLLEADSDGAGNYRLASEGCGFTGGLSFHGRIGFTIGIPHSLTIGFDAPDFGAYCHISLDVHGVLPIYAYYIDSLIDVPDAAAVTPLGALMKFVKPQYGLTLGGATGNFSIKTGGSAKYPSTATSSLTWDDPTDFLAPDGKFGDWDIDGEYDGLDFQGSIDAFTASFFLQMYAGIPNFDFIPIDVFAGLTGKIIQIDAKWENKCEEETDGENTKDQITLAFSNAVGAVAGVGPAYGISISAPNPFEKRSEVPTLPEGSVEMSDALEEESSDIANTLEGRSGTTKSLDKRLPGLPVPGGAVIWTFKRWTWAKIPFCVDNIFSKRSQTPRLETGGVPRVRRGTGFFDN